MAEKHELYVLDNEKIFMNPVNKHLHHIDDIYIDMTGWKTDEDLTGKGVYPYRIDFNDDSSHRRSIVCTGNKSGGMKKLLEDVRQQWHLVPVDNTRVHIIAPQGYINHKSVVFGGVSICSVQGLRKYAMDALDFQPTTENNINARLESVLDEVVHQEVLGYSVPITRGTKFKNSIYNYADKDYIIREQFLEKEREMR